MEIWIVIVLIWVLIAFGLIGFTIGQDHARKTSRQPVDRLAASVLFGQDASLWTKTDRGWKIGPVTELTVVKVPRWYVDIITYESGHRSISGVMCYEYNHEIFSGCTLELIPPLGYR